ncbi:MAG: nuclear transport factor 2 family protein [Candidatus Limnocylindrales bacterium]
MTSLTPGDGQDLLAAWKRGVERRSPDDLLELCDPDIDFRPDPFSEPLVGLNAVHAHWNEFAASQANVEFDAERVWVSGNTVLASWHGAYTRRATAERVRVRGFMTLELTDDRHIQRFRQWPTEQVVGTDSTFEVKDDK